VQVGVVSRPRLEEGSDASSAPPSLPEARFWSLAQAGVAECALCPARCRMTEGQVAPCGTRQMIDGRLHRLLPDRIARADVVAIESIPFAHVLPGTRAVLYGVGGHNGTPPEPAEAREAASPEDVVGLADRTGCAAVAYGVGDPVVALELATTTARATRDAGLVSLAVTAARVLPGGARALGEAMDAVLVRGPPDADPAVGEACEILRAAGTHVEVALPERSEDDTLRTVAWIAERLGADTPVHLGSRRARNRALAAGLRFVYTSGERPDPEGQSLWCPRCGAMALARWGQAVEERRLDEGGRCATCAFAFPGLLAG
jgi:pyruvate formate lyase activating enzyme